MSVASPPSAGGVAPADTPMYAPSGEACPMCQAPLHPDQEWCLRCGAAARTRLAASPNWKGLTSALAVLVALSLGVLAAALVSLAGGSGSPAPVTRTVTAAAAAPTTTTSTVPTTATTTPAATTPATTPTTSTTPTTGATQSVAPGAGTSTTTGPANRSKITPKAAKELLSKVGLGGTGKTAPSAGAK